MSQSEIGFRTAALGFRREDVLEFIAQETKRRQEIEEELEHIREEAAELRKEREEADRASKTLLADHEENAAALQKKDQTIETLQEELAQARAEIEREKQARDRLRAEYTALEQSMADTKAENKALLSKCGEYDNARSRLADIELCAHGRADEIEHRAEKQAHALIEEAKCMAEQLLQTITQSKGAYWEALEAVERETERAHTRAVDALSKFDGIMAELRSQVTAQLEAESAKSEAVGAEHLTAEPCKTVGAEHERPTLAQVLGALRSGK